MYVEREYNAPGRNNTIVVDEDLSDRDISTEHIQVYHGAYVLALTACAGHLVSVDVGGQLWEGVPRRPEFETDYPDPQTEDEWDALAENQTDSITIWSKGGKLAPEKEHPADRTLHLAYRNVDVFSSVTGREISVSVDAKGDVC